MQICIKLRRKFLKIGHVVRKKPSRNRVENEGEMLIKDNLSKNSWDTSGGKNMLFLSKKSSRELNCDFCVTLCNK